MFTETCYSVCIMARKKNPISDIGNQVGAWLGGPVRQAIASTPARAVENLQNVVGNTPIGIAVQRAMSGAQTFRNEGYLSAVEQQAKFAGTDIALNAAGGVVGKGVGKVVSKVAPTIARGLARTNLSSELAPGQDLAFHFSNNPNLKVIKDVKGMRNQGANFGQKFDSTKFSPKGATYGYGPLQGTDANQQVSAAIQEALTSKEAAAAAGQTREYTMYVTKAKPLKGAKGRVKDPEYGFEVLAGDSGQSIYGKQKPIAKIPLNLGSVPTYEDAYRSPNPDAMKLRAAVQQAEKNRLQNAIARNPRIRRAGLNAPELENVHGEGGVGLYQIGYTPRPFVDKPVKSVTQMIQEATSVAPTVGKVAASKKRKARGGGKNKK